jgi:hypothetical protein
MSKHTVTWVFLVLSLLPHPLSAEAGGPGEENGTRYVRVFIEGDSSVIPKFIKLAQEKAPERNLRFEFTRDKEAEWEIRVVLSAEGSSMWSYAHGNVVVMDKKSNVLFTVTRSDRLTGKGATSALTKEFVKMLSRYYGLSK